MVKFVYKNKDIKYDLILIADSYADGNTLAISAFTKWYSPFGAITVNAGPLPENRACIDEKNHPGITDALVRSGIATLKSMVMYCGRQYPIVEFSEEVLGKMRDDFEINSDEYADSVKDEIRSWRGNL